MNHYTAQQVADMVMQEEPKMNLRTVRYYTQLGIIPPLELSGNKRVYTDRHVAYLRAIATLARTGDTLATIHNKLESLSDVEIDKIGQQLSLHQPSTVLKHETLKVNDDVIITVSPNISAELKQRMLESVTRLLRGEQS
ncbi:MerR family transcriptional regulator [Paenibacillus kobensis]|uniref:MerR family transcriptional regulator n=1 Tax=Paenibacillus kobensis TaxID=59841 RepID=UPI000FDC30E2|nr:MerR family transcriptional regulator [Paenibacillus kobensis]